MPRKRFAGLIVALLITSVCRAQTESLVPVIHYLLNSETGTQNVDWGASGIPESARPNTAWLSNFDGITPLEVPSVYASIESAMQNCALEYCVIRVSDLTLSDTVYIARSKTKIIGVAGKKLTYTDTVGAVGSMFEVGSNVEQVVFENIQLDGEQIAYGNSEVFGVFVSGESIEKIALIDNTIHGLYSNVDAHGIAVYGEGDSETNAIKDVYIHGNEVYDMQTGSSENIVVNGNVKHWEISNNNVHDVNNIAIDAIGGEGTSATQSISGRVLPGALDAARLGFIENNIVTNMTTVGNPAYPDLTWAGAIYIDGGKDILIKGNNVTNSMWAYDIGAENCLTSSNILLENNTATAGQYGDFIIGGYAPTGYRDDLAIGCDPNNTVDDDEGHGYVSNVTAKGNQFNTLNPTVTDEGTINLQFRIRKTIIIQPGLGVSPVNTNGNATGDKNSIRVSE